MSEELPLLSFQATPINTVKFKSIRQLQWDDIPGFAIVTGRNGAGKTQLLELMAYHFTQSRPINPPLTLQLNSTGVVYDPSEVAYVPSVGRFSGGPSVSVGTMALARSQLQNLAQQSMSGQHTDPTQAPRHRRALKLLSAVNYFGSSPDQQEDLLPDDYTFAIDDVDVTAGLAYVFVAHRAKILESLEKKTPGFDRKGKPIGPAPWEVVNESLRIGGFPYEVISPEGTSIFSEYRLRLKDSSTGDIIDATDLSSGEKVLLQLTLWLFSSSLENVFPRLLLLDEPDAHLHPSMTMQFLEVINEVLVKKYGIRVIMTSHSPSTVALAPDGSIFQMERGQSSITVVENRADIISILTAGLVTVTKSLKICFVEDNLDVDFYEAVHAVLSDYGPSRDPKALNPSPPIAFIAASVGSGAPKIGGGSTVVKTWIEKFDREPLDKIFVGIKDRDVANAASDRVFVIGRYSQENYLLDPLNVFCLLLEANKQPTVVGLAIRTGDEHLLRTQTSEMLQRIADKITGVVETHCPNLKTPETVDVEFTTGQIVVYPKWVVNHRGHDLLPIVQSAFIGPSHITPPRLVRALRRCRLIPKELASILHAIQNS